jgi:hypothetical protein
MEYCLLCGNPDPAPGCYLTKSIRDTIQVIAPSIARTLLTSPAQDRCTPGPLVFPRVMEYRDATMHVCRLCFQQLKRRKAYGKRQQLPMDATLVQTVIPGFMRQQDSRTRERMCAALTSPGNIYSHSFEILRTLLRKDRHRQWWEYNLRTEFFSHKTIARLVRKLAL